MDQLWKSQFFVDVASLRSSKWLKTNVVFQSLLWFVVELRLIHCMLLLFLAACHDRSGLTLNMNHDNDHCPIPTCSDKCLEHIKDFNKIKHKCNRILFIFSPKKNGWFVFYVMVLKSHLNLGDLKTNKHNVCSVVRMASIFVWHYLMNVCICLQ